MRIVQVTPSLDVGGAERLVGLLAREYARLGHQSTVVSLFDPTGSWIEAELAAAGIAMRFLGKRPGLDPGIIPRLLRELRALEPDVVHTHLHVLKYVAAARVIGGWPVAHTVHNLADREIERHSRPLHAAAFRTGVAPVAIGEAVAASILAVYGMPARATIPNGIPVAGYRSGNRAGTRASLGIAEDAPVFLTVGRLNPQKNHAALLSAFASPQVRALGGVLVVAGEGETRVALERQAGESGLASAIRFLGVRTDIPDLLAAADVFVLASTWEGNPLVVMEAMAAGLPVVATAVGSVPELVSEATGRLVPPGDVDALACEMAILGADRVLRERLGGAATRVATARFDSGVMATAYTSLFAAIVRRPESRRIPS